MIKRIIPAIKCIFTGRTHVPYELAKSYINPNLQSSFDKLQQDLRDIKNKYPSPKSDEYYDLYDKIDSYMIRSTGILWSLKNNSNMCIESKNMYNKWYNRIIPAFRFAFTGKLNTHKRGICWMNPEQTCGWDLSSKESIESEYKLRETLSSLQELKNRRK